MPSRQLIIMSNSHLQKTNRMCVGTAGTQLSTSSQWVFRWHLLKNKKLLRLQNISTNRTSKFCANNFTTPAQTKTTRHPFTIWNFVVFSPSPTTSTCLLRIVWYFKHNEITMYISFSQSNMSYDILFPSVKLFGVALRIPKKQKRYHSTKIHWYPNYYIVQYKSLFSSYCSRSNLIGGEKL